MKSFNNHFKGHYNKWLLSANHIYLPTGRKKKINATVIHMDFMA